MGSSSSNEKDAVRPHAVMLPYPAQGHIKPFMQLAKILHARGFYITFVNTQFTQERILKSEMATRGRPLTSFRFEALPDGLPPEHGRTLNVPELSESLTKNLPSHFRTLIHRLNSSAGVPPVTCIISDGILSFPQDVANELGVQRIAFWTPSACGFSAYFFVPLLIQKGYIPLKEEGCLSNGYLEEEITCIPGIPSLRVKDLPSFFVVTPSSADFMYEYLKNEAQRAPEADLVILNTFDELERQVVDALRAKFPVYTIGPLLLVESDLEEEEKGTNVGPFAYSLWTEETSSLQWLDGQKPASVLYVCFGSVAVISEQQLLEFGWGLEASNQPFLWAIRADLIHGRSAVLPEEFFERTKGRSFFVNWAPQMKILSHPSVGGFLTHSGWNSTLESICAGVPMISWPWFAEQQTNRRFASTVWQIGLEMKDVVERGEVEQMVKILMSGEEGKEMRKRALMLKDAAKRAVQKGGSSSNYLEKLVQRLAMKRAPMNN